MKMVIDLPEELAPMEDDLIRFIEGMVFKLAANSHKSTPTTDDIPKITEKLIGEVGEFVRQYMEDPHDPNAELESFDIGNFAFLLYITLQRM